MSSEASPGLLGHLGKLARHSAVYGSADVFGNVVNLLLIRVYTSFLTPEDYGTLALLIVLSTVAKIVFRLGLDAGFFRVYYDQPDATERRRLVGTVTAFAAVSGTVLMALVVVGAGALGRLLSPDAPPSHQFIVLSAADVYLGTFAFVPLNLLRIQDRPAEFSAFSAARHLLNTVLKVVLVVEGFGVAGVLTSDVLATGAFAAALLPGLRGQISWAVSWPQLVEVLRFGLPKVPHGVLVQIQNLADRRILEAFVSRGELGLYHVGYTLGTGVKFASSAFEPAWQPFVFAQIGAAQAPRTLARVITYAFCGFTAVGLGVAVLSRELVMLLTAPEYHASAAVVPVVTLAYVLHGGFLLGSVGIAIEKRTRYYPLITLVSAGTNLAANFALIPSWGALGAAWATVLSYAAMAASGVFISQRLYPVPFETGRLIRVASAAVAVYLASLLSPAGLLAALAVKAALLASYPVVLGVSGFLRPDERAWLGARLPGWGHSGRA